MPHALIEDAMGDVRNARTLARVADWAYLPQEAASAKFRSELGMAALLIAVDNTQVYVASNDEHIVVAFRGTEAPTSIEGLKDWLLTDALNLLMVSEGRLGTDLAAAGVGARFHQGFVSAIDEIWEPLHQAVEAEMNQAERPLWITGHSLGGALALLAAWLFTRKMIPVHQIYTFGGPMIGNQTAIEAFNREFAGKIFRYVNFPDPVPKLPTMSLIANQFSHCDHEILLGASDATSATDFFGLLAKQTIDGLLNATLIDDIWKSVQARIGAHAMKSYRMLVGNDDDVNPKR